MNSRGLNKFIYGQNYPLYNFSVAVDFKEKNILFDNKIYKLQIWDSAGQERFNTILRIYYKTMAWALMVYNITNRKSFNYIMDFIKECRKQEPKNVFMILVGNFCDLNDKRQVSILEGQKLADKYGIEFYEVSSNTDENINEMFYNSVK